MPRVRAGYRPPGYPQPKQSTSKRVTAPTNQAAYQGYQRVNAPAQPRKGYSGITAADILGALNMFKEQMQQTYGNKPRVTAGTREYGQAYQDRSRTQMPDRYRAPQAPVKPYTTPISYSTPINTSAMLPTQLPDSYMAGQQRNAESWNYNGRTLPDTLQAQADRVYDVWTHETNGGKSKRTNGGKSVADLDYGHNAERRSGGYGGGYGSGWSNGGGGGGWAEEPPTWYQIMTTWNYG